MITALCDEYPRLLGRHREIFVAVLLTGIYICALPTTTYVRTAPDVRCFTFTVN
jgi:solute carrier family 6 serotonin transporter-like protein 4